MRPIAIPLPLKIIILSEIVLSLFSPLVGTVLSLSLAGIQKFYFWQFISYGFTHPAPFGITFPFLIYLAFNAYLLWVFGSGLLERMKTTSFLGFYFTSVLFGGLCAWVPMVLFHLPFLYAGPTAPLYAVLIAWTIFNPDAYLRLFFTIPLKASWLVLGLISANLLVDLSGRDWMDLFSILGASLYAYLFVLVLFRQTSPYRFLQSFERNVLRFLEKLRHIGKKGKPYRHSNIYDIKSGDPILGDEQFMDAMLARIAIRGEDSITPEERKRMQQISERKSAKKPK